MKAPVIPLRVNDDWSKNLAALIDHQRLRSFPPVLEEFLATLCAFDTFLMATYKKSLRPINIHPDDPEQQSRSLQAYFDGAFELDPLFHAIQKGISPGIVRLVEIMPESFETTEYYRSCYRNFGLVDEINLVIRLSQSVTCVITLGRRSLLGSITRSELKSLQAFFPIIDALVRQFWQSQASEFVPTGDSDQVMHQALKSFASGVLTQREREVTGLILRGFSTKEIAEQLNISVGTVKVHRKNIHARLKISTQSEIFTQFLAHLNTLKPAPQP